MSDEVDAVLSRVRERVAPDAGERARLQAALAEVTDRAEDAIAALPVDADVLHVGSTARDTWIAGDRDIDVFVSFPTDLDRDSLESCGLEVGHAVLPDGHEEYAEHPYVVGTVEGYQIDLVPCYAVEDATDIRSAVDRTPFHNAYLTDRLDDRLADEVRVAKQFLKAVGVYGSNLRTRGFSGFLVELLVAEYGGVRGLLEAAADWHPPVALDPEAHGQATFADPLVVIDPTDPERNVAAVCSESNVARLQHYARRFLADPEDATFERSVPDPLSETAVREAIRARGTTPVAVRFETPDLVDDQLYPQLEKSLGGVTDELDRRGFDVLRADAFATTEDSVLFVELEVADRPTVERHEGPPVHVREHAENFYRAYADDESVTGPFVDGDRYVVEREREFSTARAFLESPALLEVALGAHVRSTLEVDYEVLVEEQCGDLAADFGRDLATFFDPSP